MPGGDRTGPMGAGPMTGRGAGFCAGVSTPGYANSAGGRGFFGFRCLRGFGMRGGGRGRRNWFHATGLPGWERAANSNESAAQTEEQEKQALKQEAQYLKDSLDSINKRIEELEK